MASILVVDDNAMTCRVLAALLRSEGHEARCITNPVAAVAALLDGHAALPDLIVLDVMMPELDGIEVLARIRADARLAQLPVVMYTAVVDADVARRAAALRAADYLIKTAHWHELYGRLRQHIPAVSA